MHTKTMALLLLLWGAALTPSWGNRTEAVVKSYIDQYKWIAMEEMRRSGIPASITLAQGLLESRMGMSDLSRHSNNHFGIKCKRSWVGDRYYHKDDDLDSEGRLIKSCFRVYNSPEESYRDHSDFLKNNRRYARLFELSQADYKGWAHGLRKCGYATDTQYAYKLIQKVEAFRLYEYDRQVLGQPGFPGTAQDHPQIASPAAPPAFVLPDDYRRGQYKQGRKPVVPEQMHTRQRAKAVLPSKRRQGTKKSGAQVLFLQGATLEAPAYHIH